MKIKGLDYTSCCAIPYYMMLATLRDDKGNRETIAAREEILLCDGGTTVRVLDNNYSEGDVCSPDFDAGDFTDLVLDLFGTDKIGDYIWTEGLEGIFLRLRGEIGTLPGGGNVDGYLDIKEYLLSTGFDLENIQDIILTRLINITASDGTMEECMEDQLPEWSLAFSEEYTDEECMREYDCDGETLKLYRELVSGTLDDDCLVELSVIYHVPDNTYYHYNRIRLNE